VQLLLDKNILEGCHNPDLTHLAASNLIHFCLKAGMNLDSALKIRDNLLEKAFRHLGVYEGEYAFLIE
jgi:hypothetical protein